MYKLALLTVLAAGCVKTDSSDILTSGMYALISAETRGAGTTHVDTQLYLGSPSNLVYIELGPDDELRASAAGESKRMAKTELLNIITYHAELATDAEGTEIEVSFLRSVDDGAPRSVMTLPAPFALEPLATPTISRTAAVTAAWAPSGSADQMSWQIDGDCIERESQMLVGDSGSLTIEAGRVRQRMGDGIADTCEVTLTVTRARPGQLDPGYGKGGTIHGRQVRTLTFTSTP